MTPNGLEKLSEHKTEYGALITGFQRCWSISNKKKIGDKTTLGTMYLGSRKSNKIIRVYDANENHGVDAIDWELELHNSYAKEAWKKIMEHYAETRDVESTYKLMASIIVSSVNFVDRTDKNVNRCTELPWWTQFKSGFETVKLAVKKAKTTIESARKWLKRFVAPTLGIITFSGLGITTSEIKEKGFDKIKEENRDRISNYFFGMFSEVDFGSHHLDRLSAAEARPQATPIQI